MFRTLSLYVGLAILAEDAAATINVQPDPPTSVCFDLKPRGVSLRKA